MEDETSYEIKAVILRLLDGTSSNSDVVSLLRMTKAIAKTYLKIYFNSFLKVCSREGYSEDDLAEESVLELFERDDEGRFIQYRNFANSCTNPIELTSEEEIFRVYRSFVQTVSLRQLARLYTKLDPVKGRIYRNIKDSIRKTDSISLYKDARGTFLHPSDTVLNGHLPQFPFNGLEQRFASRIMGGVKNTLEMLTTLAEVLNEQNIYRRLIPLFDAVKLFERHYTHIADNDFRENVQISHSALSMSDLKKMKLKVLRTVQQKILTTYVVTDKIKRVDASKLYFTLESIIEQWFDESREEHLYLYYYRIHFGEHEAHYEAHWRTKVEYMARVAREQITAWLTDEL